MDENLPENSRRVGPCVVTRNGYDDWTVVFLNGPTLESVSIDAAINSMIHVFGADENESINAFVSLMEEAEANCKW